MTPDPDPDKPQLGWLEDLVETLACAGAAFAAGLLLMFGQLIAMLFPPPEAPPPQKPADREA